MSYLYFLYRTNSKTFGRTLSTLNHSFPQTVQTNANPREKIINYPKDQLTSFLVIAGTLALLSFGWLLHKTDLLSACSQFIAFRSYHLLVGRGKEKIKTTLFQVLVNALFIEHRKRTKHILCYHTKSLLTDFPI